MITDRSKLVATTYTLLAIAIAGTISTPAHAEPISVIVEEISEPVGAVAPMDLLVEGKVIKLGKGSTLVLGYLRSCLRETITGGTITIGVYRSIVVDGKRTVEQVTCDGGTIDSDAKKSPSALGAVFREQGKHGKLPKPERTLFGVSPIIRVAAASKELEIRRLDNPKQPPIKLSVGNGLVDVGKAGIKLEPGGLYYISDGLTGQVVKISLLARDDVSVLSKFLPM